MAGRFDFGSRPNLSVSSPLHAANDVQGSENPIPLSPQWLLPKPGESKHGISTGENNFSHQPAYGNRMDMMKGSENYEDMNDIQKKKEVFRPSLTDAEIGRRDRDRWHDEERENNSSMRKDRWRDGEKEVGDSRKMDRWTEDSSTRVFRESRRGPSERWSDSSNRDNVHYDQRRESKWNTRWGPDDKETEGFREKRVDPGRDGDLHLDKNFSHVSNYGKNDRDGDHYRPWRSSSSQGRGKGESPHHQTQTPIKQVPVFSHRGRTDNTPPTFSLGRGIISSGGNPTNSIYSSSNSLGASSEISGREPYYYKYSRTKLLDVFRTTNLTSPLTLKDGFVPVPTLTLDEPLEPLALCAPTTEEMTFLKGIDKGEIVSSGAPQVSKDGRSSSEFMQTRRTKLGVSPSTGSREDLPHGFDDYNDDKDDSTNKPGHTNYSEVSTERHMPYHRPQSKIETIQEHMAHASKFKSEAFREEDNGRRRADEVPVNRESSVKGGANVHHGSTWDASSLESPLNTSLPDWRDNPNNISSGTPDKGWLQSSKNLNDGWGNNSATPSYPKDNPKWQTGEESMIRRQLSGILDKEQLARKTIQSAPEDLQLHYIDPAGAIQGPFRGADIIQWFEGGYFGLDLPVRPTNAPNDLPFAALGDVMPHLRSKAKPPPGFSGPKQNEFADTLGNTSYGSLGKLHTGLNEIDNLRNETRHKHGSTVEAENRFLESLMSGSIGSSPLEMNAFSEGVPGYFGNNSNNLSSLGIDNGNNLFLLAKRMELERQRSLTNPYAFWPGIDATSKVSKPDIGLDDPIQQAKLLSSIIDHSRQTSHSQSADISSILQGLPDKAPPGMHHDLNLSSQAPFGFQQQRLQPQLQPQSLANLLAQATDNPTLTPDKFLPSSLSQDPQLISKLQQQHLLQLQSQVPFSAQQMSLLDKLLLLKQQQKQEEQQQLLQQQQLLSQVLSEHQSRQHFSDPTFGQLQGAPIPIGNVSTDPSQVQLSREKFQIGSQKPLNVPTDRTTTFGNMAPQVTQGASYNVNSEDPSLSLPHHMFGNVVQQKSWNAALPEQLNDIHPKDMFPGSKFGEGSLLPVMTSKSNEEVSLVPTSSARHTIKSLEHISEDVTRLDATVTPFASDTAVKPLPLKTGEVSVATPPTEVRNVEISIPVSVPVAKVEVANMPVQKFERDACKDETSLETELKIVEVQEPRKSSDKKSKKQKSAKLLSSDQAKDSKNSASQQSKQSKSGKPENDLKLKADNIVGKSSDTSSSPQKTRKGDAKIAVVDSLPVQSSASAINSWSDGETVQVNDSRIIGSDSVLNSQIQSGQSAWKVAKNFKAKSLLEIQEEEQKMAHTETAVSEISTSINSMSLSTPWAGIVSNLDPKASREIHKDSVNSEPSEKHESLLSSRSRKSQLHDLLAEDDMEKSGAGDVRVSDSVQIVSSPQVMATQVEPMDDNFIEAKDTKKSRKKSAKAKGVGTKASSSAPSVDVLVSSSPIEKGKISRQTQLEKDAMPSIPSGPSFGDFVLWKGGEAANVAPAPAWSSDSGKGPKPTSLRDIQKEQGKKLSSAQHSHQIPAPQKAQPTHVGRSSSTSTSSRSLSASSPSKAASSPLLNSSSQPKYGGGDDDLFWGPIDSKQENQHVDVRLGSHGSWGSKNTPAKAAASTGLLSRQKSSSGKADYLSSSPAQSSQKGKQDSVTKHSEAMGFRDWCESECVRLIGTKDTSFLEFCLKQSRSEAELILIENLGSYDPGHKFIDQFLNYKELLPADVIEIAFQSRNDRKVAAIAAREVNSGNAGGDLDPDGRDGTAKGGGKKKGKKGKKINPSVLGFNVVSNRIMMGEIQTVED